MGGRDGGGCRAERIVEKVRVEASTVRGDGVVDWREQTKLGGV
jgi:hypothetical protein